VRSRTDLLRTLGAVRFKLFALVPTLSSTAISVLGPSSAARSPRTIGAVIGVAVGVLLVAELSRLHSSGA
jgi:hypothetical protein